MPLLSALSRERAVEQDAMLEDFYWKITSQAVVEMEDWFSASILTSLRYAFLYCRGWEGEDGIFQTLL